MVSESIEASDGIEVLTSEGNFLIKCNENVLPQDLLKSEAKKFAEYIQKQGGTNYPIDEIIEKVSDEIEYMFFNGNRIDCGVVWFGYSIEALHEDETPYRLNWYSEDDYNLALSIWMSKTGTDPILFYYLTDGCSGDLCIRLE